MTKMKRITAAILCAILCTVSLCAALIYAEADDTSKFSQKLLEHYQSSDTYPLVHIYYEDTVDFTLIETAATEYAEAKVEQLREEGGYTEEELQAQYDRHYNIEYRSQKAMAYKELNVYMQTALGLEECTDIVPNTACITGFFSYEQSLEIAKSELVISLTRKPAIEDGRVETEEETEGYGITSPYVPDETDPEPTTDSTEPTDPTEPPTDAPDLLVGDVDEDGLITATDASNILILAAEMGLGYEPTFEELYAADYNADGNADATDASLILIFAAEQGAA